MAGAALEARGHTSVVTAGTFVVEGLPISWRTRDALAGHGLDANGHRSRQLRARDLAAADVVVAMAVEHVAWVRRMHPEAAAKTVTLRRLCRDGWRDDWATVELDPSWEDIEDPGGGEVEDFRRAAAEVVELVAQFADSLAGS